MGFLNKNPTASMMGMQTVSGAAEAYMQQPALEQAAATQKQTADDNSALTQQKIKESEAKLADDQRKIDNRNAVPEVTMAYTGESAYKDSQGRAINAQDYWANAFNRYFGAAPAPVAVA